MSPLIWRCMAAAIALGLSSCSSTGTSPARAPADDQNLPATPDGRWTQPIPLKDMTLTYEGTPQRPRLPSGWWVTPIHANLLPSGDVLVTGWSRQKPEYCENHKGRQNGTTFILKTDWLDHPPTNPLEITPIIENEYDPQKKRGDVMYCTGHAPQADGKILFAGGARYTNLDFSLPPENTQDEFGLNYARVYDPATQKISLVGRPVADNKFEPYAMPAGPDKKPGWDWYEDGSMWYPTVTRLPGGRFMVFGGYAKWFDVLNSAKWDHLNLGTAIYDPNTHATGKNPWTRWVKHEIAPPNLALDVFDYEKAFLLPKPVTIQNIPRQLVYYGGGKEPRFFFLSTDPAVPEKKRWATRTRAVRPKQGNISPGGADTTAAMLDDGKILVMGGGSHAKAEAQRIDIYDPYTDSWNPGTTTWDAATNTLKKPMLTGITRNRPSSVLLPDGTVLILAGEKHWEDNTNASVGNRTQPTIYNPRTKSFRNLAPWSNDSEDRGYHNVALLLKDGRVLVGGGRTLDVNGGVEKYRIGCERTDLRIFSPPYLTSGAPRPDITKPADMATLSIGTKKFQVHYTGPSVKPTDGVVLMAMGAHTHSFDQNQRIISLKYTEFEPGKLMVDPPFNSQLAPEGYYNLFIISKEGTPSVAHAIRLISGT